MRGLLRAGQVEDVYVQFTPGDQFKYFYDSIRIHAEGDKIIIPMHAFPIINRGFRSLIPKVIDMGRVHIGQIYQKELFIESTCPLTFEYDIKEIQGHSDITMMTPRKGDIVGLTNTPIVFQFKPQVVTMSKATFELRTSQFDFQPYTFYVMGNADPLNIDVRELYEEQERELREQAELNIPIGGLASNVPAGPPSSRSAGGDFESDVIKRKGRTLLTDKTVRRIQVP